MRKVRDIKPGQLFFMDQQLLSDKGGYVMLVTPNDYHQFHWKKVQYLSDFGSGAPWEWGVLAAKYEAFTTKEIKSFIQYEFYDS